MLAKFSFFLFRIGPRWNLVLVTCPPIPFEYVRVQESVACFRTTVKRALRTPYLVGCGSLNTANVPESAAPVL